MKFIWFVGLCLTLLNVSYGLFTCDLCLPGTFCFNNALSDCPSNSMSASGSDNITDCICNEGFYGVGHGCVECPVNTYCLGLANEQSSDCPVFMSSPAQSTSITDCVCNAGYTGPNGGTCVACVAGTYKSNIGSEKCVNCSVNTYSVLEASTDSNNCVACPANFISATGSDDLEDCISAPGFFSPSSSTDSIFECPLGTYQPNAGMTVCFNCSAETYNDKTNSVSVGNCLACPANSVVINTPGVDITDCLCNAGYTGGAGETCLPCVAGTYKTNIGTQPCTFCAQHTYSTVTAMSEDSCVDCPSNSYSSQASASIHACKCGVAYDNQPSQCAEEVCCVRCSKGSFKNDSMTQCAECPASTYSVLESHCESCFENSVSGVASSDVSECVCVPGFERLVGHDTSLSCEPCEPGYANKNINGSCVPCDANTYNPLQQALNCLDCPENSITLHSASVGLTACLCYYGYETISIGQDMTCSKCPAGSFKATLESGDVCAVCAANTYSSVSRNECLLCPDNSASESNSSSLSDCLCVAGHEPTTTSPHACGECDAGFHKPDISNNNCSPCAAGYYVSQFGADQCVSCAENSYADAQGSAECTPCMNHSFTSATSQSATDCWCVAGYFFSGQQCVQCAVNTYKTTEHALTQNQSHDFCHACAIGQYTVDRGSTLVTECLTCPANYYIAADGSCQWCGDNAQSPVASVGQHTCQCNAGYEGDASIGLPCSKCETGTYKEEAENNVCVYCAVGQVGIESGTGMRGILPSHSCVLCAVGKYWSNFSCVECPANATSVEGAISLAECVCVAGYERTQDVCEACAVGKYSNEGENCQLCTANTYSDTATSTLCTPCPMHTSSDVGASSEEDCLCNMGYFLHNSVCTACAVGTYKEVVSSVQQCTGCGVNHYLPLHADGTQDVCQLCPAFSFVTGGQGHGILSCVCDSAYIRVNTTCRACKQDHYCINQYTEIECPVNSHSELSSASSKVECLCDAGHYGAGAPCTICPINFYCPNETVNPQACPPNSSTIGVLGRRTIEDCVCDIGYHNEDNVCHLCAEDSWCYANVQYNCPPNSSAVRGSSDVEDCRCDDGLRLLSEDHPNQECVPCMNTMVCRDGQIEECSDNAFNENMQCVCMDGMYCQNTTNDRSCSGSDLCQNCTEGHWCADNVQRVCAANEDSPPRSSAHTACRCKQGYYRLHGECIISPVGFYAVDEVKFACVDFDTDTTTLHEGSYLLTQCQCQAGYYRTDYHDKCKPCPTNFYCPSEHQIEKPNVVRCPENELTLTTKSTSIDSCVCLAGFKLTVDGGVVRCLECDVGELCSSGQVLESLCHLENKTPNQDHSECVCMPGYGLVVADCVACPGGFVKPLSGNTVCENCPSNQYSVNKTHCQSCPEHSQSRPASATCECAEQYIWDEESASCKECPENMFWDGIDTCTACPHMSSTMGAPPAVSGIQACVCANGFQKHPVNTSSGYMCIACPENHYESNGLCVACPPNSVSAGNSTSIDECVCVGCHRQLVDASCAGSCALPPDNCTACASGFAKPLRSQTFNYEKCVSCAYGTYQPNVGATMCLQCPTNEYHHVIASSFRSDCLCVEGYERINATCERCNPGHYKNHLSNVQCTQCDVGTFQALDTSTACNLCSVSTRNISNFASFIALENVSNVSLYHPHPTYFSKTTVDVASTSVFDCVCALGYESKNSMCTACETGSFKESVGLHDCRYCGSLISGYGNTFVNKYGNTSQNGATSIEHCLSCPAFSGQDAKLIGDLDDGFTFVMNDETDCKCFPGHHNKNSNGCSNCSTYEIQPYYSDDVCSFCPDGHYFVANNQLCQMCAVYTHNLSFVHTGIVVNSVHSSYLWATSESDCECMLGFERLASNDGRCTPCSVGHFRNDNLTRQCQECAANTFLPVAEGLECLPCPVHSSTLNVTACKVITECICDFGYEWRQETETCQQCPAGKFRNVYTAACQICHENFYCPIGTINPIACPESEVSVAESSDLNDCTCETGSGRSSQSNAVRQICQVCPAGSFTEERSNAECELCPANKNTSSTGATSKGLCKCVPGHGVSVSDDDAACSPCLDGFFASGGQNIACFHCGWGTVTEPPTAADSADSCQCDTKNGLYSFE